MIVLLQEQTTSCRSFNINNNVIIHVNAPANQPIFMSFVIICSDATQTARALL